MTVEAYSPPDTYTVAGTGPYAVPHAYAQGALRLRIETDAGMVYLPGSDWTVSPAASEAGGNVTLSDAIADAYAGRPLTIERDTAPQQGWSGRATGAERALEVQLDQVTMAVQDLRTQAARTLRGFDAVPPVEGLDVTAIGLAGQNAVRAEEAAERAEAARDEAILKENSMLRQRGAWTTATAYAPSDIVQRDGSSYVCILAHTAGASFAADLAAARWTLFAAAGLPGEGSGDLLATNNLSDLADRKVARDNLGIGGPFVSPATLVPAVHLRRAALAGNAVTVVNMGDSLSTVTPLRTFDEEESYWGRLQAKLIADNPGIAFTFHNRAIAGTTQGAAVPNSGGSPNILSGTGHNLSVLPWVTDGGARIWLDYVQELQPDILFLAWGMNDRDLYSALWLRTIVQAIRAWPKVPDIVLVTPMLPTTALDPSDPNYATIASPAAQNGRLFSATLQVSYAQQAGLGVLDANRVQCQLVYGFDPRETYFTAEAAASNRALPWTAPETDQDTGFEVSIDTTLLPADGRRLQPWLSMRGDQTNGSRVEIYNTGGKLTISVLDFTNAAAGRYLTHVSEVDVPASPTVLRVVAKGSRLRVTLAEAPILSATIRRGGGRFAPVFSMSDGSTPTISLRMFRATFRPTTRLLTAEQMWGSAAISANTEGGNDLNHPTALGWSAVFGTLFAGADLRIPRDLRTVYRSAPTTVTLSGSVSWTHGLGARPDVVQLEAVCTVADSGYAVGDRVVLSVNSDGAGSNEGISLLTTDTTLTLRVGNGGISEYTHKTNGGAVILSPARWQVAVTAIRF